MKNPSPALGYALVNKETGEIVYASLAKPFKNINGIWKNGNGNLYTGQLVYAHKSKFRLIRVEIKPVASKRKKV